MSARSGRPGSFYGRFIGRLKSGLARPRSSRSQGLLEACLGPLEMRVLECLWQQSGHVGVRAVMASLPGFAYTTIMTTLDRLYKKDLLDRRKEGRAFLYHPTHDRAQLEALLARGAIDDLLQDGDRTAGREPVLASFVEAVGGRDSRMLDELERLIRRYRAEARRRSPGGGSR